MVQKVVSSVEMDPDPRWEFKANQFVDFNTIDQEQDDSGDEF